MKKVSTEKLKERLINIVEGLSHPGIIGICDEIDKNYKKMEEENDKLYNMILTMSKKLDNIECELDLKNQNKKKASIEKFNFYKIKNWKTQELIYFAEGKELKDVVEQAVKEGVSLEYANLYNADLRHANLREANLRNADLTSIKNYYNSKEIAFELFKRIDEDKLTDAEYTIIAKIQLHDYCWTEILELPKEPVLSLLNKLKDFGYEEYLNKYNKLTKGET